MKIEHVAIWVQDLEKMKLFYQKYFRGSANELYQNSAKQFSSYFISFEDGARLELMHRPDISLDKKVMEAIGFTHLAISVGSKEKVDQLTLQLSNDGYKVKGQPRTTGDGYYESVVIDPEGNLLEITI